MSRFHRVAIALALILLTIIAFVQISSWLDSQRLKGQARIAAELAAKAEKKARTEAIIQSWLEFALDLHAAMNDGSGPTRAQITRIQTLMDETADVFPEFVDVDRNTGHCRALAKYPFPGTYPLDDITYPRVELARVICEASPLVTEHLSEPQARGRASIVWDALRTLAVNDPSRSHLPPATAP